MYVNYELKTSLRLVGTEVLLGREVDSGVRIPNPIVCRKHASIKLEAGERIIENLGVNGTKVNGKIVERPMVLKEGDAIFIADYILVYHSEQDVERYIGDTTLNAPSARQQSLV